MFTSQVNCNESDVYFGIQRVKGERERKVYDLTDPCESGESANDERERGEEEEKNWSIAPITIAVTLLDWLSCSICTPSTFT